MSGRMICYLMSAVTIAIGAFADSDKMYWLALWLMLVAIYWMLDDIRMGR